MHNLRSLLHASVAEQRTMHLLKDCVRELSYRLDYTSTFAGLISKLRQLNIGILEQDEEKGEIVVRYLSTVQNWLLWRCWSDKLLFKIRRMDEKTTKVEICVLPNLARIKIKSEEMPNDVNSLIGQLNLEK